jgi:hypothetical protein
MNQSRVSRERKTITVMISMYCKKHHHTKKKLLCPECAAIDAYAMERIDKCPLIKDKPTCVKCPVHCYKPDKRELVGVIMRYAGPRMLLSHPILTIFHVLDGLKKEKNDFQPHAHTKL